MIIMRHSIKQITRTLHPHFKGFSLSPHNLSLGKKARETRTWLSKVFRITYRQDGSAGNELRARRLEAGGIPEMNAQS